MYSEAKIRPDSAKTKCKAEVIVFFFFFLVKPPCDEIFFVIQLPGMDLEVPVPEPIRTRSRATSTLRSGKF